MNLPPQSKTVLSHLRAEPHITSWQAEGVYRIRRLASRIDELVAAGYDIQKTEARDATGQRYIRYSLGFMQRRFEEPINPVRVRDVRVGIKQVHAELLAARVCPCVIGRILTSLKESA